VRALFIKNKMRFVRAEQLWLQLLTLNLCCTICQIRQIDAEQKPTNMCFLFRSSSTKGVLHRSVCANMLIHKLSSTFYDSNMIAKVYVWLTKKKTTLKIQNCRIL